MQDDTLFYKVELAPQYTQSEIEQLEKIADTAQKLGVTLSIWQVIMLIVLGKALDKMWTLINVLQLIVYMGLWNVSYSPVMITFLK